MENEVKYLYRGIVMKVQSPEALLSLGVVPVVSFATPESKERIEASAGWNVGTLEKPEMPLKVDNSWMLIDVHRSYSAMQIRLANVFSQTISGKNPSLIENAHWTSANTSQSDNSRKRTTDHGPTNRNTELTRANLS